MAMVGGSFVAGIGFIQIAGSSVNPIESSDKSWLRPTIVIAHTFEF
jgi:hypothetical protein